MPERPERYLTVGYSESLSAGFFQEFAAPVRQTIPNLRYISTSGARGWRAKEFPHALNYETH